MDDGFVKDRLSGPYMYGAYISIYMYIGRIPIRAVHMGHTYGPCNGLHILFQKLLTFRPYMWRAGA